MEHFFPRPDDLMGTLMVNVSGPKSRPGTFEKSLPLPLQGLAWPRSTLWPGLCSQLPTRHQWQTGVYTWCRPSRCTLQVNVTTDKVWHLHVVLKELGAIIKYELSQLTMLAVSELLLSVSWPRRQCLWLLSTCCSGGIGRTGTVLVISVWDCGWLLVVQALVRWGLCLSSVSETVVDLL